MRVRRKRGEKVGWGGDDTAQLGSTRGEPFASKKIMSAMKRRISNCQLDNRLSRGIAFYSLTKNLQLLDSLGT